MHEYWNDVVTLGDKTEPWRISAVDWQLAGESVMNRKLSKLHVALRATPLNQILFDSSTMSHVKVLLPNDKFGIYKNCQFACKENFPVGVHEAVIPLCQRGRSSRSGAFVLRKAHLAASSTKYAHFALGTWGCQVCLPDSLSSPICSVAQWGSKGASDAITLSKSRSHKITMAQVRKLQT